MPTHNSDTPNIDISQNSDRKISKQLNYATENIFKDVWASIKLCGENMTTDVMMITQRGLTLPGQVSMASSAEIELDDLDEIRDKDYCRIIGYHGRNLKTFLRRTGNAKDTG